MDVLFRAVAVDSKSTEGGVLPFFVVVVLPLHVHNFLVILLIIPVFVVHVVLNSTHVFVGLVFVVVVVIINVVINVHVFVVISSSLAFVILVKEKE